MDRFLIYLGILVALSFMLFGPVNSAFGQILGKTQRCDVYVNDYRVTFPASYLNLGQCQKLMDELKAVDQTEAKIKCLCLQGNQS